MLWKNKWWYSGTVAIELILEGVCTGCKMTYKGRIK